MNFGCSCILKTFLPENTYFVIWNNRYIKISEMVFLLKLIFARQFSVVYCNSFNGDNNLK